MKKELIGIIGVCIAVIGFSIYYTYAYFNYNPLIFPPLNPLISTLSYIPLMVGLSLVLIQLMVDSNNNAEFLIYGINAVLWLAISLSFVLKDILHIITTKLFIISVAVLCSILGICLYFYKQHRK